VRVRITGVRATSLESRQGLNFTAVWHCDPCEPRVDAQINAVEASHHWCERSESELDEIIISDKDRCCSTDACLAAITRWIYGLTCPEPVSLLPLTQTLTDYASMEEISDLPNYSRGKKRRPVVVRQAATLLAPR
jgi:hypothetical protein